MEEVNQSSPTVGRPSDYTKEIANYICELIADGKSLRSIARREDMPAMSTIFAWLRDITEFSEQYEKACQDRVEAQYEDLNEINDEAIQYAKTSDTNVQAVMTAYKLKADNMKWSMSKMKPKKYGDKLDVVSDGEKLQTGVIILPSKNDIESQE